jgi:hypothetical protein
MGLRTRFNLVFLLVALPALGLAGYIVHSVLERNAREEVLQSARILMDSAIAVRQYTVTELKPLLVIQQTRKFIPQIVPAYGAAQYAQRLQKKHPEYSYREATLNPTNPDNRAADWEADIVRWFGDHKDAQELVGERQGQSGRMLYLGRPITIKNPDCLYCHDTAEKAPHTMVELYGPDNGFGWKLGETIGAQLVTVPMSVPVARADESFRQIMLAIGGVLAVLLILLNILMGFLVSKPARQDTIQ